jgi:hypothetical protein
MAIVYRHIRLDKNEPFYIGIGKTDRRAHRKDARNKYWNRIVSKTDYRVEILFDDLTWEEACEKEKEFIKLYGRKDLGLGSLVNMTDGGDGQLGLIHSEETKQKIGLYHIGNKWNLGRIANEKTKKKMSISHMGNKSNTDRKLPIEHRLNISEGLKGNKNVLGNKFWVGRNHSEETKEKMKLSWVKRKETFINPRLGKFHSEETKEKMRGKKHSEETKEKMREAWIKRKEKQLI